MMKATEHPNGYDDLHQKRPIQEPIHRCGHFFSHSRLPVFAPMLISTLFSSLYAPRAIVLRSPLLPAWLPAEEEEEGEDLDAEDLFFQLTRAPDPTPVPGKR
jgi:hypothetical protein